MYHEPWPGPEIIKLFSWSTQQSMKFQMLISIKIPRNSAFSGSGKPRMLLFLLRNVKMPTNIGILTFMSGKNFMVTWAEHEKSFITSRPDFVVYWLIFRLNIYYRPEYHFKIVNGEYVKVNIVFIIYSKLFSQRQTVRVKHLTSAFPYWNTYHFQIELIFVHGFFRILGGGGCWWGSNEEGEKTFEARCNVHNLLPIHYIWWLISLGGNEDVHSYLNLAICVHKLSYFSMLEYDYLYLLQICEIFSDTCNSYKLMIHAFLRKECDLRQQSYRKMLR